jgi:hypothetical protein
MKVHKLENYNTFFILPTFAIHTEPKYYKYLDIMFWKWVISIELYDKERNRI